MPGSPSTFGEVDQPVAAHPDLVFGFRQLGDQVAPLIVGHHDLGELGGKIGRFRDHPHARFRPARSGDDAADFGRADLQRAVAGRATASAPPPAAGNGAAATPSKSEFLLMSPSCVLGFGGGIGCRHHAIVRLARSPLSARADGAVPGCARRAALNPLPPSISHGVRSPFVLHSPRPFQPAFGSSMRPSRPLAKKPMRVRDAQHDHLPVLERGEAVIEVGGRDRNVLAEARPCCGDRPRCSSSPRRCRSRSPRSPGPDTCDTQSLPGSDCRSHSAR